MRKPYYKISILLFLFLTACGSNHLSSTDTGSISFNLKLSHPTTMSRSAAAISADICDEYGITDINVNLFDSSHKPVTAGHWSCKALKGTLSDIPAGENYTIEITGTVAGVNAWSGKKIGVGVTAGETTTTGIIMMDYTGNDKISPKITSTTPSSDPAAVSVSVPVTSMITAKFSEKMAASTINDSTFKLYNGATPVSGTVVYVEGTRSAYFSPSNILLYSPSYNATLTTDIEDMATNKLAEYNWSFTTEDQPPPDTQPAAPVGLIAFSGDKKNIITWDAIPAATSYEIYWSETSGVKKGDGVSNMISDVKTNLYTHTGLSTGTKYYYVVTALNSNGGESVESYEISSAPGSTDGNPPTGFIIINNNDDKTNSRDVTLSLSSSSTRGVSEMCISDINESEFIEILECSSWEPYTSSKPYTLISTGDGPKRVVVWFKDSFNISNLNLFYDRIVLDTASSN